MVDFQEIKDKFLPIFYAAKVQENLYFKGSLLISLIFYPNSLEVKIIYLLRQCLSQSLPDFFPEPPPDLSNITPETDLLWYEQAGVSQLQPGTSSQLRVRPAAGERYWSIEAQRRGPVGEFAVRGVYFCWDVQNDPDLWFAQVSYSALVLEP